MKFFLIIAIFAGIFVMFALPKFQSAVSGKYQAPDTVAGQRPDPVNSAESRVTIPRLLGAWSVDGKITVLTDPAGSVFPGQPVAIIRQPLGVLYIVDGEPVPVYFDLSRPAVMDYPLAPDDDQKPPRTNTGYRTASATADNDS